MKLYRNIDSCVRISENGITDKNDVSVVII